MGLFFRSLKNGPSAHEKAAQLNILVENFGP